MNIVEIIEKQPRLTGGRRGSDFLLNGNNAVDTPLVPIAKLPASAGRRCGGTLLPGTNAVSSNLVPVSNLPPSAGSLSLASVMDILNKRLAEKKGGAINDITSEKQAIKQRVIAMRQQKGGKKPKTGGKSLARMLADPEKNLTGLVEVINESPVDANAVVEGSGRKRRGRPKKGGAIPKQEDMVYRRIGGKSNGGKMSSLIPPHGHGATTQIGTNYKLSQFGGSIQPIGNTASTLSPVLSTGSVGAGRTTLPKNKKVKEILHLMVKGRRLLKGKGLLGDAWNALKKVATELYHEFGPQIFEGGKKKLIDFLKDEAEKYILGHHLNGGGWFSTGVLQLGVGLVSMGKSIFKAIIELLGEEIVNNLKKEIVKLGVDLAKRKGEQLLGLTEKDGKLEKKEEKKEGSGRPGGNGHGRRKPPRPPIGSDPSTWTPKTGGKSSVDIQNLLEEMAFPQNRQNYMYFNAFINPYTQGDDADNYTDAEKKEIILQIWTEYFPSKGRYFNGNEPLYEYYLEDSWDERNKEFIQACADRDGISYDEEYTKIWETNPPNFTGKGRPSGCGRKQLPHSGVKRNKARGAIVSEVMKKQNLSLPMASKYVKEHGLY